MFYGICTLRDKGKITSSLFEKLIAKKVIKNQGLMKVDLSLGFQNGAKCARQVNFLEFCHIMLRFYEAKMVGQYGY